MFMRQGASLVVLRNMCVCKRALLVVLCYEHVCLKSEFHHRAVFLVGIRVG